MCYQVVGNCEWIVKCWLLEFCGFLCAIDFSVCNLKCFFWTVKDTKYIFLFFSQMGCYLWNHSLPNKRWDSVYLLFIFQIQPFTAACGSPDILYFVKSRTSECLLNFAGSIMHCVSWIICTIVFFFYSLKTKHILILKWTYTALFIVRSLSIKNGKASLQHIPWHLLAITLFIDCLPGMFAS